MKRYLQYFWCSQCLGLTAAWLLIGSAHAVPLQQLLMEAEHSTQLEIADAEIAIAEAEQQLREGERGWTLFAGVSHGSYNEIVINDWVDSYRGQSAALGLRYPLLGSLRQRTQAVEAAALDVANGRLRRNQAQAQHRLALRLAYANWWRSTAEADICRQAREVVQRTEHTVSRRLDSGDMRLSEAMNLVQHAGAISRLCDAGKSLTAQARSRLSRLTRQQIADDTEPTAQALASAPLPAERWNASLGSHPQLQQRQGELDLTARQKPRWYHGVQSSFTLAQQWEQRQGFNQMGDGLVASINFEMPLSLTTGRSLATVAEGRERVAKQRLALEREKLSEALDGILQAYRPLALQVRQQQERLNYLQRLQTEIGAREQVESNRAQQLTVGLEIIEAQREAVRLWHRLWQQEAELRFFLELTQNDEQLLGEERMQVRAFDQNSVSQLQPAVPAHSERWSQGTYMWDSRRLLDSTTRARELERLLAANIKRVYLGLSPEQLAAKPKLVEQLRQVIADAARSGINIHLLLGEPLWITEAHRTDLIGLIQSLAAVPFAGLHLDLEVEQLGWPVPAERLREWIITLQQSAQVSPWPLSISSHYRWFLPDAIEPLCVACELRELSLETVSVMAYIADPVRPADLAETLAQAWPQLRFRLAQSAEPNIEQEASWAHATLAERLDIAEQWRQRLQDSIHGIDWQDWKGHSGAAHPPGRQ